MKYLKMFLASLRMAKTLENKRFAHDTRHVASMIDELCPEDGASRSATTRALPKTHAHAAPGAA